MQVCHGHAPLAASDMGCTHARMSCMHDRLGGFWVACHDEVLILMPALCLEAQSGPQRACLEARAVPDTSHM